MVWALGEPTRANRLLDLTGLTVETLRISATSRATQAAILGFLEAYEPDLIACATALDVPPDALVVARRELES
jgi:hypothetical protein